MLKVIALAVAIAAVTSVAGAQGASTTYNKSTAKPGTAKSATAKAATAKAEPTKSEESKTGAMQSRAGKRHRRAKGESEAALRKEAKITEETARATALKEVPNGKVKSHELERENGKLIYSFAITVPGKSGIEEVNVDAIDGSVVSQEHESAKTERKEVAAERKEVAKETKTKK